MQVTGGQSGSNTMRNAGWKVVAKVVGVGWTGGGEVYLE